MTRAYDDEEMPLPLLHRAVPREREIEAEDDIPLRRDYRDRGGDLRATDRLSPAAAGALTGALGGAAGLGVVHAMHLIPISQGIARLAERFGVPPDAAMPVAYLAAAVGGAILGAGFASVAKHLRRSFAAVLLWAVIFFVSLTTLVLAISSAYGRGIGVAIAPSIILASVAFAFIWAFQLPLRRRG